MTREKLFEIFTKYKARGYKAELQGRWVDLDGWKFDWDDAAAIMKRVLTHGSY